jgi:serine/threonine protein kinase
VIFYQLISGKHPFEAQAIHAMSYAIVESKHHELKISVSPLVKELINQMLCKNPSDRPDA